MLSRILVLAALAAPLPAMADQLYTFNDGAVICDSIASSLEVASLIRAKRTEAALDLMEGSSAPCAMLAKPLKARMIDEVTDSKAMLVVRRFKPVDGSAAFWWIGDPAALR